MQTRSCFLQRSRAGVLTIFRYLHRPGLITKRLFHHSKLHKKRFRNMADFTVLGFILWGLSSLSREFSRVRFAFRLLSSREDEPREIFRTFKKKVVLWIHNDLLRYNTLEIIVTKNCQSSGRSPKVDSMLTPRLLWLRST